MSDFFKGSEPPLDFTLGDFNKAVAKNPSLSQSDIARIVQERMDQIKAEIEKGNKDVNLAFLVEKEARESNKPVTAKEVLDLMHKYLSTGAGLTEWQVQQIVQQYFISNPPEFNSFTTFESDSGTTTADTPNDTLVVTGVNGITTSIVGDSLIIDGGLIPDTRTGVSDEGSLVAANVTDINFVGAGVTATDDGDGTVTVTIPGGGGGSALETLDEGISLSANTTSIDFVGAGVTATNVGSAITVTIPGGGSTQNLYETFTADSGIANTANSPTDTLAIVGGTNISTVGTSDTITINGPQISVSDEGVGQAANALSFNFVGDGVTASAVGTAVTVTVPGFVETPQNLFETVTADSGSTTADTSTDTLTVTGSNGITTSITGDTLTIVGPSGIVEDTIRVSATTNQNLTAGAETVIQYSQTDHDVDNADGLSFDNVNDEIDVLYAGRYHATTALQVQAPGVGIVSNVSLRLQVDEGSTGTWVTIAEDIHTAALTANETYTLNASTDWDVPANSKFRTVLFYDSTLSAVLQGIFPVSSAPVNHMAVHVINSNSRNFTLSEEGTPVITSPTDINFVGTGVTVTDDGDGTATVTISAGGGGGSGGLVGGLPSGTTIYSSGVAVGSSTGVTPFVDTVSLQLLEIDSDCTVTGCTIRVDSATSVVDSHIAIYEFLGNGQPGACLGFVTFTPSSANTIITTNFGSPIALTAGAYFLGLHNSSGTANFTGSGVPQIDLRTAGYLCYDLNSFNSTAEPASMRVTYSYLTSAAGWSAVGDSLSGVLVDDVLADVTANAAAFFMGVVKQ